MIDRKTTKLTFDRQEKNRLSQIATQMEDHPPQLRGRVGVRRKKRRRLFPRLVLTVTAIVGVLAVAAAWLVNSGTLTAELDARARQLLINTLPDHLELTAIETSFGMSWPPSLALRIDQMTVAHRQTRQTVVDNARITIGVDPLDWGGGVPRLGRISIEGAHIDWGAFMGPQSDGATTPFSLASIPDRFNALGAVMRELYGGQSAQIAGDASFAVNGVTIALSPNSYSTTIAINTLEGTAAKGRVDVAGIMEIADKKSAFSGLITGLSGGDSPMELDLQLAEFVVPFRRLHTMFSDNMSDHEPGALVPVTLADLRIQARDGPGADDDSLSLSLIPQDMTFKLTDGDLLAADAPLLFKYEFDKKTIDIAARNWRLGRSQGIISGGIRDVLAPSTQSTSVFAPFEFELLVNRGRIAPSDSPEEAIKVASRMAGTLDLGKQQIRFDSVQLDSEAGYLTAEGMMTLGGAAPNAVFQISVNDMTVAGLKQLWPAPVARQARRWVLNNLTGGKVTQGLFDVAEPLRRRVPGTDIWLEGDTKIDLSVEGVRFDITGELPPVRDGMARIIFDGGITTIKLEEGRVFLPSGRTANARNGLMVINRPNENGVVMAQVNVDVSGTASALGEVITYRPIQAQQYYAYEPDDLSGNVDGRIRIDFALNNPAVGQAPPPNWDVDLTLDGVTSAQPIEGRRLSALDGTVNVTPKRAILNLDGDIDGLAANIAMTIPFAGSDIRPEQLIVLNLDTDAREKLAPGLSTILTGETPVRVVADGPVQQIAAGLKNATLTLPWIGWSKGRGIDANVSFALTQEGNATVLRDFDLDGGSFGAGGSISADASGISRINFSRLKLNDGDQATMNVTRKGRGYDIRFDGESLDLRALIRHIQASLQKDAAPSDDDIPVTIAANLGVASGFSGEVLRNIRVNAALSNGGVDSLSVTGTGGSGAAFSIALEGQGANRRIRIESQNAGEFLRFFDIYGQVRGGNLVLSLSAGQNGNLSGPIRITNFQVFNEPALARLVSNNSERGESLRDVVKRDIDTSQAQFDVAEGVLTFGDGTLDIAESVVRGPNLGFAFQGRVFDKQNQMRVTGTFLPAYGLNSAFADIPILGLFMGTGRDRGLIGVTFLLEGEFGKPNVTINPLSIIAPGIFRQIFQFR